MQNVFTDIADDSNIFRVITVMLVETLVSTIRQTRLSSLAVYLVQQNGTRTFPVHVRRHTYSPRAARIKKRLGECFPVIT